MQCTVTGAKFKLRQKLIILHLVEGVEDVEAGLFGRMVRILNFKLEQTTHILRHHKSITHQINQTDISCSEIVETVRRLDVLVGRVVHHRRGEKVEAKKGDNLLLLGVDVELLEIRGNAG